MVALAEMVVILVLAVVVLVELVVLVLTLVLVLVRVVVLVNRLWGPLVVMMALRIKEIEGNVLLSLGPLVRLGAKARCLVRRRVLVWLAIPCVRKNAAGLLVCRPRTLLMDTLVVLGLRGVLLEIVHLNRPEIGRSALLEILEAVLLLLLLRLNVDLSARCMLLNRRATELTGSPTLLFVGRCTSRLPPAIMNELPAERRLCME